MTSINICLTVSEPFTIVIQYIPVICIFIFRWHWVFSRIITPTYQRSFQIYLRHLKTDNSTVLWHFVVSILTQLSTMYYEFVSWEICVRHVINGLIQCSHMWRKLTCQLRGKYLSLSLYITFENLHKNLKSDKKTKSIKYVYSDKSKVINRWAYRHNTNI